MFGYNSLGINENGVLTISGVDAVLLAKIYGTPLYVIDEAEIIRRCNEIRESHIEKYGGRAVYASKAFLNKEMCRIIERQGLGLDVVSGGELYTARAANFPMERIIFHGNNKSLKELEMAVDLGVGRIVIDSFYEIDNLNDILKYKNKKIDVQIRINPGIDGHTHEFIKTGNVDSKFGFPLFDDSAFLAVKSVLESSLLNLKGLHLHLGSQLHQKDVYVRAVTVLAEFIKRIKDELDYEIEEINLGGGFGIFYTEDDSRKFINYFTDAINISVIKEFNRLGLKRPIVYIEPGRWIIGEAGFTIYTVGAIKEIKDVRKYISVDGGMADNPRPPLYGAKYLALLANKITEVEEEVVTIAGKCCESGDILIRDISLPKVESGDILVVLSTGAYNYSMASNYNRLPRPAVVLVNNGNHRLIVKRETYEDLIRNDI